MAPSAAKLFVQFTCLSASSYSCGALQDGCQHSSAVDEISMLQSVPANDEISMLQSVPAKRDVASVLVADATEQAKAQDLDPQVESSLVAAAMAEGQVIVDKAEILHPSRSAQPLLIRAIEFYKRSLETWPHLTNGIAAYFITTMGDASAQIIQGGVKLTGQGFDVRRNAALACTAAIYSGIVLTSWLAALNTAFPGFGLRLVMGKLAATQTFLQPFVYVPFFFIVHGMFCGQTFTEIRTKIRSDYFTLLFRLWSLFMPTRFLMFLIIPVRYQVLWDNTVAFIWQFALSLMIANKRDKAESAQMLAAKKGALPFIFKKEAAALETPFPESHVPRRLSTGEPEAEPTISSDAGY